MSQYSQRALGSNNDGYWAGEWFPDGSWMPVGWNAYINAENRGAARFSSVNINQGTTISSAYLKLVGYQNDSDTVDVKIVGINEDDTADFGSDPSGRSQTSNYSTYTFNGVTQNQEYSINITSLVQEIINRGGWASGHHLGLQIRLNGSGGSQRVVHFFTEGSDSNKAPLLEINWSGVSPSASVSPSSSVSPSPSASVSPSASISPSSSPSPSPMPPAIAAVLKVGKSGVNVLTNSDPEKNKFDSEFGTLKYFDKQSLHLEIAAADGEIGCSGAVDHNKNYYPYVEVYVSVNGNDYEYCPFAGAGATVFYGATFSVKENQIVFYGFIDGMSENTWTFDFIVFIYNNDLQLN